MDAQISYAFHSERKMHPEKFKNQLINQVLLLSSSLTRMDFGEVGRIDAFVC